MKQLTCTSSGLLPLLQVTDAECEGDDASEQEKEETNV